MDSFEEFIKKDDILYFVHKNILGKNEVKCVKVSKVYPKTLITFEDRGMSQCIDLKDKDYIFMDEYSATKFAEEENGKNTDL